MTILFIILGVIVLVILLHGSVDLKPLPGYGEDDK